MSRRIAALFVLVAASAAASSLSAEEFRIESDIFVEGQREPVLQTLTLFKNGVVYDFRLPKLDEITIFEPDRKRFVLLDDLRQVKTEVSGDQIIEFLAQVQVQAKQQQAPIPLDSDLQASFDPMTGWLSLSSPKLIYRAKGVKPKLELAAIRYQEFADWYARLNAMTPGNVPPFARIRLNAELGQRGLIPEEVERILVLGNPITPNRVEVRSRHFANWTLSNTDLKRIEKAGQNMATFKLVPFAEYYERGEKVTKK